MNADRTTFPVSHLGVRLTGALLAAAVATATAAVLGQSLHVGRLAQVTPVVTMERVTVSALRPVAEPAFAAIVADAQAN